jgi:hypothetical protein
MRAMTTLIALSMALSFVFAGCMDDAGKDSAAERARVAKKFQGVGGFVGGSFGGSVDVNRTPVDNFDYSKVIDATHGGARGAHAIRKLHEGSHGLELVSYDPLVAKRNPTAFDTGFVAIDVWSDIANKTHYACVTHFVGNGGVDIVDISDPKAPKPLSFIDSGMLNSDCQFTDDGKYLLLGAYLGVSWPGNVPDPRNSFRQVPLAGAYDLAANGVSAWDVTDKANPKFLFFSETGTYHNLYTVTIDGTYYILQTYSKFIYKFDPKVPRLQKVSETTTMVHDMTVTYHPITGDRYIITGKGQGTAFINFNDPLKPVDVGEWAAEKGATGWHEQEAIPQLVDGRAIVIVAGETGGGNTLPYGVVDWTDPANPMLVGQWVLPGNPKGEDPNFYTFSPHEIYTWNGYVAVANYHAGVWVFDVGSKERMANPVTIGYYLPHEEPVLRSPQAVTNAPFVFNPDVWGAYFDDRGYIVTADWSSGLYILKMPATETWTPPYEGSHN